MNHIARPWAHISGVVYPDASAAGAELGRLGGDARAQALSQTQRAEIATIAARGRWGSDYLTAKQKRAMVPPLCSKLNCAVPALHCCPETHFEDDFYHKFCPAHREEWLQGLKERNLKRKKNAEDRAAGKIPPEPIEFNFKIEGSLRVDIEAAAKASGFSVEEWAVTHLMWAATLRREAITTVEKQEADFKAEIERCLNQMVANGELKCDTLPNGEKQYTKQC